MCDKGAKTIFMKSSLRPSRRVQADHARASAAALDSGWWWTWLVLLVWMGVVFLLINLRWPGMLSGEVNIYLAQPAAWASLFILGFLGWRYGLRERPPFDKRLLLLAGFIGVFQIALAVSAGLFMGFGHSPYGHRPLALMGNLLYVSTMLVGMEMCRAYLVRVFNDASPLLSLLLSAYLFTFLSVPLARYESITGIQGLFRVTGQSFLPLGAENLLASLLAMVGGPLASITYRGLLAVFEWLSPVLPDLHWTIEALLGTMAPVMGLLAVHNYLLEANPGSDSEEAPGSNIWIAVGMLAVMLIWFNTGFFGVQPTLVSGVSMEPALNTGDVAITRDVPAEVIRPGDVIRFHEGGSYILHRVVEVRNVGGEVRFITQGDANNTVDAPVTYDRVRGKVILVLPKIGWVGIGVRELVAWIR